MAKVRLATEADIPRIIELYRQLTITTSDAEKRQSPSADDYKNVFDQINQQEGHSLLVAEEDGQVTGTMVFLVVPSLSHNGLPWAVIENMVVEENKRRSGAGRLLVEYALKLAGKAGCYKIQLASTNSRKEAHTFYRSMGFIARAKGFRLYL